VIPLPEFDLSLHLEWVERLRRRHGRYRRPGRGALAWQDAPHLEAPERRRAPSPRDQGTDRGEQPDPSACVDVAFAERLQKRVRVKILAAPRR
jgi:hypothetical protein